MNCKKCNFEFDPEQIYFCPDCLVIFDDSFGRRITIISKIIYRLEKRCNDHFVGKSPDSFSYKIYGMMANSLQCCQLICLMIEISLKVNKENYSNNTSAIIYRLKQLYGEDQPVTEVLKLYWTYFGRTFESDILFSLDAIFRNLCDEKLCSSTDSIKSNIHRILDHYNISMNDCDNPILAFITLRNTLHNNGIHNKKTIEYNIRYSKDHKIKLLFKKDKSTSMEGIAHGSFLLEKSFDLFDKIAEEISKE